MKPGECLLDNTSGPVHANAGRKTVNVMVRNTGDRPIQVGSHFHFFETNRELSFGRAAAFGMRLNVPSGTAIRFEPGEEKQVELTEFAGARVIHGFNGLVGGAIDSHGARERAIEKAAQENFQSSKA
jgi:urease subunit beta